MREVHEELAAAGADLVAIGGAFDFQARALRDDVVPVTLLLDPQHRFRKSVDFGRLTMRQLLGRDSQRRYVRALREARQGAIRPRDAHQAPGVVILTPDQRVAWRRKGESLGDYPPLDEVLAALKTLTG